MKTLIQKTLDYSVGVVIGSLIVASIAMPRMGIWGVLFVAVPWLWLLFCIIFGIEQETRPNDEPVVTTNNATMPIHPVIYEEIQRNEKTSRERDPHQSGTGIESGF